VTVQSITKIVLHEVMHKLGRAELILVNFEAAFASDSEQLLSISSTSGIIERCITPVA
jgi:hypothetical protein